MRKDEKKFIKITVAIVSLIVLAIIYVFCYLHYKKYHFVDRGRLIAKVDGNKIYEKDIETRMSAIMGHYGIDQIKIDDLSDDELKAVLLEVYLDDKIYNLARKIKLTRDNDIKFLAKEYYERLVREKYLREEVFNKIKEEEIRQRYDELVETLNDKEERKISHIFVEDEDTANRIRSLILARRDSFENLARKKSLDKESAKNDGCIGYVLKEEIAVHEFAEIAFMLKVGEMSRPVKALDGWYIIRVDDSRKINIRPYEEARDEILEKITSEKFNEFMENNIQDPKIELYIKIREEAKNDDKDNNNGTQEADLEYEESKE